MLEKRIATCDRQNFRKRLIEFEDAIKEAGLTIDDLQN